MANSLDTDETARYQSSHLDLHSLFGKVSVSVCRDERAKLLFSAFLVLYVTSFFFFLV